MSGCLFPFEYPSACHVRRHGPDGYSEYEPYREWLRDGFCFRCIYCLGREKWITHLSSFIDHFFPRKTNPAGELDYDNLVYACSRCNLAKSAIIVDDPTEIAFGSCLKVTKGGCVKALNATGKRLIRGLGLNFRSMIQFRRLWLQILSEVSPELQTELLGFPDDLPDLGSNRPTRNRRPDGIQNSYFEQKRKGVLPLTY